MLKVPLFFNFTTMQEHYVCKGACAGVSVKPGTCQMEGCDKYHQPLEECTCGDISHHEQK